MIESSIIQARSASEWILWLLADSLAGASSLYAGAKVLNGVAPPPSRDSCVERPLYAQIPVDTRLGRVAGFLKPASLW